MKQPAEGNPPMTLIPDGFQPLEHAEGYIGLSGPFFWRREEDGRYAYGFSSDGRHGNPDGALHGAATLKCATIALTSQFVSGVPTGGWVSGRADIRRLTKALAFVDAEASAGNTLLLTATAIFRVFQA
jgi:hypothetical protein